MEDTIIQLQNVSKCFGKKIIINNINMDIKRGQSIALIGRNGSGKSTFLKMVAGLVNISDGKILKDKRLKFGYIPENFPKLPLTVNEYLEHIRLLDKLTKEYFLSSCKVYFEQFGMEQMTDIPLMHLSKGTLQKVVVIQALLAKPDVLLLDEPLSGQDIQSQKFFIHQVKEMILNHTTIIMSCHENYLIQQLASQVYEIKDQRLYTVDYDKICDNSLMYIRVKSATNRLDQKFIKGIKAINYFPDVWEIIVEEKQSNQILLNLLQQGYEVISVGGFE